MPFADGDNGENHPPPTGERRRSALPSSRMKGSRSRRQTFGMIAVSSPRKIFSFGPAPTTPKANDWLAITRRGHELVVKGHVARMVSAWWRRTLRTVTIHIGTDKMQGARSGPRIRLNMRFRSFTDWGRPCNSSGRSAMCGGIDTWDGLLVSPHWADVSYFASTLKAMANFLARALSCPL